MATLLSTLQVLLDWITGGAYTLSAGKAKSVLLALTEMMVTLDALGGEIVQPQHNN